jgi:hypothetical protein
MRHLLVALLFIGACDSSGPHQSVVREQLSAVGNYQPEFGYQFFTDFDSITGPLTCTNYVGWMESLPK